MSIQFFCPFLSLTVQFAMEQHGFAHACVCVCVCAHAPCTGMHGEMMAPEFRVLAVPVLGTQVLSLQHYYRYARHSPL